MGRKKAAVVVPRAVITADALEALDQLRADVAVVLDRRTPCVTVACTHTDCLVLRRMEEFITGFSLADEGWPSGRYHICPDCDAQHPCALGEEGDDEP